MKKYFCLLLVALCLNAAVKAAPGDTTWVQANINNLSWYGNYDTTVAFPANGKTYRNIFMIFTLGKYMCPGYNPAYAGTGAGGTGWCGDWDYTVQNYLVMPNGKNLELGRFITPYANALAPRTPWNATQHYVYDVTDYAPVLKDSCKIRIFYSGYSGGFTGNILFMMIEGAPDREVLGIHKLWGGSYGYGDTTHAGSRNINLHFPTVMDTAPASTVSAALKVTVTGHGSDPNYCNEFCSHNYYVYQNNAMIDSYVIWRPTCGSNELYPQSGTWLYERANWCPGAMVYSEHHDLHGIYEGTVSALGLQFEPYNGTGGASYTTEATLFYYGEMKKTLDASIEQIIAPTANDNYYRENPICGSPVIHIKNRGVATIDSINFIYGLNDTLSQTYTWKGSLATFAETDVTLPPIAELNSITGDTLTYKFTAKITDVNAAPDADSTNNVMSASFLSAPVWPSSFRIFFETNNESISSTSDICETAWQIFDLNNNVVASRVNALISKTYIDTVKLPTGCYKLVITDSSCDGLHWWVNDQSGSGITAGYLNVRKLNASVNIPMHGYNYSGTYNNDFGCGFTQYFYTTAPVNSVTDISETEIVMDAYPNPARDMVNVDISGIQQVKGTLQLMDELGRVVELIDCQSSHQQLNVASLAGGVYTILYIDGLNPDRRLTTRLLIMK